MIPDEVLSELGLPRVGQIGYVVTDLQDSVAFCRDAFGMADPEKTAEMAKALDQIPLRRVGDPEKDIGPVAVFLASEDSDFITGHTFMVDGGAHMF